MPLTIGPVRSLVMPSSAVPTGVGVCVGVSVTVGVDVGVPVIVGVSVSVGVDVRVGVDVSVNVAVCVGVSVTVGVSVGVRVFVGVGVFVGVFVGVPVGVGVRVGVWVGNWYVYVTQTVTPAVVVTCVMTLPAPPVEKDAVAATGRITVPGPLKSLIGVYEETVADFVSMTPASVLPDVGMKSVTPS